jgi:hypothetical protein
VLQARIARVETAVATLQQVRVRLDWPADAPHGELQLGAKHVDAADLGYRWHDLDWRCRLQREAEGGWSCAGALRSGGGRPMRLALRLDAASTDASLSDGDARFALRRSAAAPDATTLDLTRVPIAWAQALLAQAWPDAQLKAGTLDGRLVVETPDARPLRVAGTLEARAVGLETADASIAAQGLGGRFTLDYRRTPQRTLVAVDGALHGGEFLAGSTYVALPAAPVELRVDALQTAGQGWDIPHFAWHDGEALSAEGSAAFDAQTNLQRLDLSARSRDLSPLRERYLSGQLAVLGLDGGQLGGAAELQLRLREGALSGADLALHDVALRDPEERFGFAGLDGTLRYAADGQVDSELAWRSGRLYGLDFGAARLPLRSRDGVLLQRAPLQLPMMGGRLRFSDLALKPPKGDAGLELVFALELQDVDFGLVSKAVGLPAFQGRLSGRIPRARFADERLDFDGGLSMRLFDGDVRFSALALERPFGTAPSLSANIDFQDLDLLRLTEVLDFGSITGRLDGYLHDLRLVDWTPVAFDARFRSDAAAARVQGTKQRISQRAVQSISSVGGGSFVGSLQGRLIALFDDFGYARIGIGCRLANEVCRMAGLEGVAGGDVGGDSDSAAFTGSMFTIVQGAGLPRLDVVGHNRDVDWSTLVERIAAVGKGDVSPVVE